MMQRTAARARRALLQASPSPPLPMASSASSSSSSSSSLLHARTCNAFALNTRQRCTSMQRMQSRGFRSMSPTEIDNIRHKAQMHKGDSGSSHTDDADESKDGSTSTSTSAGASAGAGIVLIDVREEWELEQAAIKGDDVYNIPLSRIAASQVEDDEDCIDRLFDGIEAAHDKDAAIAVFCHHGVRSQRACLFFEGMGWKNMINMEGGIDKYQSEVDDSVGTY